MALVLYCFFFVLDIYFIYSNKVILLLENNNYPRSRLKMTRSRKKLQKGVLYGIQCGKCHHVPRRNYTTPIKSKLEKHHKQSRDCIATVKIQGKPWNLVDWAKYLVYILFLGDILYPNLNYKLQLWIKNHYLLPNFELIWW